MRRTTNWNIDEEFYPGPVFDPGYTSGSGNTFSVAGSITMPIPTHYRPVPEIFKAGDVYLEKGQPTGIIVEVDYDNLTFTIQPQGVVVR